MRKKYVCEKCEPSLNDAAEEHRELCKRIFCKKCNAITWHYPTFDFTNNQPQGKEL